MSTYDKAMILAEIKRTAALNQGRPLGVQKFTKETGIQRWDWLGKYWTKWGDALAEAGFVPNSLSKAPSDELLLEMIAAAVLELGHVPTHAEIRLYRRRDPEFPSRSAFERFGSKATLIDRLTEHSAAKGLPDLAVLCEREADTNASTPDESVSNDAASTGYVYLIQHGKRREFKIGRTNNILRREGEIRLELPHETTPIHVIETDDPSGVEAYWHRRFSEKRLRGEWFELTSADVAAFRRWKRIF